MLPDNIFIAGKMGAGKDTIAATLVENGFTRLAFADALKEELAETLGVTVDEINRNKATYRAELQKLGAARRVEDESYWIQRWLARRTQINGPVVCPDVRYLNEALFAIELGGLVVRVVVPEAERIARLVRREGRYDPRWAEHESEIAISSLPVHAEIPGDLAPEHRVPTLAAVYATLRALTWVWDVGQTPQ